MGDPKPKGGSRSAGGGGPGPTDGLTGDRPNLRAIAGRHLISRRRLLALGGMAGAASIPGMRPVLGRQLGPLGGIVDQLLPGIDILPEPFGPQLTFTRTLRRREDFLRLRFDFFNLQVVGSDPAKPKLDRKNKLSPGYIVVGFPPQHLADEAYPEDEDASDDPPENVPDPAGGVRTRLAGESRLAFQVPPALLPLDFDLDHLLAWAKFPLNVVDVAKFTGLRVVGVPVLTPQIRAPKPFETGIEIPWFLVLSPPPAAGWAHALGPVTHGNRTELWHTRLGVVKSGVVDEAADNGRTAQAVWARDPDFDPAGGSPCNKGPFVMSLRPRDRHDIVRLTSDFTLPGRQPVAVNRLMLSSLGGWLDSRGAWDSKLSLEEWRHRATMGRDSYVRVIRKGFLFPFGHKAVKITITERQFETANGTQGAYLRQRRFIVVRQQLKEYGNAPGSVRAVGQPDDGRGFPFRSVRITTLVTPDIHMPEQSIPGDGVENIDLVSMPYVVAGSPFQFHLIGEDWAGEATEFTAPLIFVDYQIAFGSGQGTPPPVLNCGEDSPPGTGGANISALYKAYNALVDGKAARPTGGQRVAFAPPDKPGDTTFETARLLLGAAEPIPGTPGTALVDADQPAFYPIMREAHIRLAAAEQVRGAALAMAAGTAGTVVAFDGTYTSGGFDGANPGQAFLTVPAPLPVAFEQSDRSGGLVTPNLAVTAITRSQGPVGGAIAMVRANSFDVAGYFAGARILGGLSLDKIIPTGQSLEKAPVLQTTQVGTKQVTRLHWEPAVQSDQPEEIFIPGDGASLTLDATFETDPADPAASTFEITGDLRNFSMQMLGKASPFLIIEFKRLTFTTAKDRKADVRAELGGVTFTGDLEYVEALRNFLPSLGKGLSIDVTAAGIDASLSLPLPSIPLGVFSLQNLSIEVGTRIPFDGTPARVRFSFCTRENPFLLTVTLFGGGGFVGVECGLDGDVMLEVALEFGAAIALDIGVASGSVEIMAGIYVRIEKGDALLGGYLRITGEVCALGLVSVSCELYLSFTYESGTDKCTGQATFYAEIDVLLFSGTVTAEVERKFGGQGDPTFAQLLGPDQPPGDAEKVRKAAWAEYCNAYEPIGA